VPPSPHAWRDRGAALAAWASPLLVVAMIGWLLLDLLLRGISAPQPDPSVADASLLERWAEFLTSAPQQAGRSGGILPMLVSTMLILAVCLAAALPIGVGTALLLSEVASAENRFARTVRSSLDVLASVPSIVFGLFGNALFCRWMGLRFSILSGGLTLACMVLPLLIRAAEEGFRAVSLGQRQAAFALGFSRTSTIFRIILPQAGHHRGTDSGRRTSVGRDRGADLHQRLCRSNARLAARLGPLAVHPHLRPGDERDRRHAACLRHRAAADRLAGRY
jgi:phosphate transport system permease protein